MNRRGAFVGLVASVAGLAVAEVARGQPAGRPRRIGFLHTGRMPLPGAFATVDALVAHMRERGFEPDRDLVFLSLYAEDRLDDLPGLAARLLAWQPDIIVTLLSPAAHAAKRATDSVPIVMLGAGDPVASGLVRSLARPGGNLTGVAAQGPELAGKSIEHLRELRPSARRVAALLHDSDPFTPSLLKGLAGAADTLSLELDVRRVVDAGQYEEVFEAWRRRAVDGVFVQPSLRLRPAIDLAQRHRLPSCSFVRGFVEQGGLLAYATSLPAVAQLGAGFVEQILRGARPADLPVQQAGVFDLLLNRRSAAALGIVLPKAMLLRATEVLG